jgi:hypothetical protein
VTRTSKGISSPVLFKTFLKIPKKKDNSSIFIIPDLSPKGTCLCVNADTETSGETTERDDGIETLTSYVNVMTQRDAEKEKNRIWWERFKKDVDLLCEVYACLMVILLVALGFVCWWFEL